MTYTQQSVHSPNRFEVYRDDGTYLGYIVRVSISGVALAYDPALGKKVEWFISPVSGGLVRAKSLGKAMASDEGEACRFLEEMSKT